MLACELISSRFEASPFGYDLRSGKCFANVWGALACRVLVSYKRVTYEDPVVRRCDAVGSDEPVAASLGDSQCANVRLSHCR